MEKKVIVQKIDNRLCIASQKSYSQNVTDQNATTRNPVISSCNILKSPLTIFKDMRRFPTNYTTSPGGSGRLMISNDDLARSSTSGTNYNPTVLSQPASFKIANRKAYLASQSSQKACKKNLIDVTDSSKLSKPKSRKAKTIKCASRSASPRLEPLKAPKISGTSKKQRLVLPKKDVPATHNDQSAKTSTSLSNQKSIVVLKSNLMPVGLDSKKSATSSVPDFLENDTLEKGLEVLNSLDDSSLDDLVTKVMDVVNKMYGDYLEEELSAYLGAEKYRQIASQELTTFPEFSARQYVKLDHTYSGSLTDIAASTCINANSQFPKAIGEQTKSKPTDNDVECKTSDTSSSVKITDKISDQVTFVEKQGIEEEYFTFNRFPGARLPEKIFESPEMVVDPVKKQSFVNDHVPDKIFETPEKDKNVENRDDTKRTRKKKPKLLDFDKLDENKYDPLLSKPSTSFSETESIINSSPEGNCATSASHENQKNFGSLLSPMLKSPESLCVETRTPEKDTCHKKYFTGPGFKTPKKTSGFPGIPNARIQSLLLRMRGGMEPTTDEFSNKSEESMKLITKGTEDKIELIKEEITTERQKEETSIKSTITPNTNLNSTDKHELKTKLALNCDVTEVNNLASNDPNQYLPKQGSKCYNTDIEQSMNELVRIKSTTPDTDLNSTDMNEINNELASNSNVTETKILHSNDPNQYLPKQDSKNYDSDIEQSMNELAQVKSTTTHDTDLTSTDKNEMKTKLASNSDVTEAKILPSNDPNRYLPKQDSKWYNSDIEQSINEFAQNKFTATSDIDSDSTDHKIKTELASNSDVTEMKILQPSDPNQYVPKQDSKCCNSDIDQSMNEVAQIKSTTTADTDRNKTKTELASNSNVTGTKILHSSDPNQYVPKQDSKCYNSDIDQSMNELAQIKSITMPDTDLNSTDMNKIKTEIVSNSNVTQTKILHSSDPNQYVPKQDSKYCYNTDIEQSMNELAQILLSLKDAERTSNFGISNESFESFAQKAVVTVNDNIPEAVTRKEGQADLEEAANDLAAILMACDDASKEANILNKLEVNIPQIKDTKSSSCGTEKIVDPKAVIKVTSSIVKDTEPTYLDDLAKTSAAPTKSVETIAKEAVDEKPPKLPTKKPSKKIFFIDQVDVNNSSEQTFVSESTKIPFPTVPCSAKKGRFEPKITYLALPSSPKNLEQKSLNKSSICNEEKDTIHVKKPLKQSLKHSDKITGNKMNKISDSSYSTTVTTSLSKDFIVEDAVSESTKIPSSTICCSAKNIRFEPKISDAASPSRPKSLEQKSLNRSLICNEEKYTIHIKKPSKRSLIPYDKTAGNKLNNSSNNTTDTTSPSKDLERKSINNSSAANVRDSNDLSSAENSYSNELNSGENSSNNTAESALPSQDLQQKSINKSSKAIIVREPVLLIDSESDEEDCKPLKAIQEVLLYNKGINIKKTLDSSNVKGSNHLYTDKLLCSEKRIDHKPTTTVNMSKLSRSARNELSKCAPILDYLIISDSSDDEGPLDKLPKMTGDNKHSSSNVKTEGQLEMSVKKTIVRDRFVGETIGIPMPPIISNSSDINAGLSNKLPKITRKAKNSVKKDIARDRFVSETISVPSTPTGREDLERSGRRRKLRIQNLRKSIRSNIFHLSTIIRHRVKRMRNTCRIYNAFVNIINIRARDASVDTDFLLRKMKKLHAVFKSLHQSMVFQQKGIKCFKNELRKLHLTRWNNRMVSPALIKQKKKQIDKSNKLTVEKENQQTIKEENVSDESATEYIKGLWEDVEPKSYVNEPGLQGEYEEHIAKAPMKTYGRGKKIVKSLPDPVGEKISSFFYKGEPLDELGSSIINYEEEIKKEQIDSNSSDPKLPSPQVVVQKEESPQPIEEKIPLKKRIKRKRTKIESPDAKLPSPEVVFQIEESPQHIEEKIPLKKGIKRKRTKIESPDPKLPSPEAVVQKEESPQHIEEKIPLKKGIKRKRTKIESPAKEPAKPKEKTERKIHTPVRSYFLRPR